MGVATVLPSGPTTARPRRRGGRTFRERGGLPFPGAARRFQRPSQSLNLTAQSVPLTFQCAVLAPQSFGFLLLALDLAAQSVAFSRSSSSVAASESSFARSRTRLLCQNPRAGDKSDPVTNYVLSSHQSSL
jgi:hypothetical protein